MPPRTSSTLKLTKSVEEIPETQQTNETQEESQISVDGGFASQQKENLTESRKVSITGAGGGVGFMSALQGEGREEVHNRVTRSTAEKGIMNGATMTRFPVAEVLATDSQIERETGESVGWDHMGSVDGDENGADDGSRTFRIENLLPKHQVWDRDVPNDAKPEDAELGPPSSHPREPSVVEFETQDLSGEDTGDFQNTEGQVISPDRGNQRWETSVPGLSLDRLHQNPIVSHSKSNIQFPNLPQPSTQPQFLPTTLSKLQSQSQPHQKSKQTKAGSLSPVHKPTPATEKNVAHNSLDVLDADEDTPQDQWDTSMTKEEFDETVKAAKIAERRYGGAELQEYKILEQAKSPQIKAIIRTLESQKAQVPNRLTNQITNTKQALTPIQPTATGLQEKISQFVASHEIFENTEKGTRLKTLQRRRFTRDLYDYSRALGLNSDQATFQVRLARADYRRTQGLESADDTGTEFGEEIDDSNEVIARPQKSLSPSLKDGAEVRDRLPTQEPVKNMGSTGVNAKKDEEERTKEDPIENQPKKAAGPSLLRDSPRRKRKRDVADDGEQRQSSANPNGTIDKEARKAAKRQRRDAEKQAKKAAVSKSSDGVGWDGKAQMPAQITDSKNQRKARGKHTTKSAQQSDGKAGTTTTDKSTTSKPVSESESAEPQAAKSRSHSLISTTGIATLAAPSEALSKPNRKRKRKGSESIDEILLENSKSTVAAEPVKEHSPDTMKSKKKKRKRRNKGVDSINIDSVSVAVDDSDEEVIDKVDTTVIKNKKFPTKDDAPHSKEAGRIHDIDGLNIESAETTKRGRGSRGRKGKPGVTKSLTPETESISEERDQNKTNKASGQAGELVTLQSQNVNPLGVAPVRHAVMELVADRNANTETGEKVKRRRGPRARAANAGLGKGQSVENPFNNNSAEAEASMESKAKVKDKRKYSPEVETSLSRPIAKKARKDKLRRLLGTVNAVEDKEADFLSTNGNNSSLVSTGKENITITKTNGSDRKAKSDHHSNGRAGKSKNSTEGKARHL